MTLPIVKRLRELSRRGDMPLGSRGWCEDGADTIKELVDELHYVHWNFWQLRADDMRRIGALLSKIGGKHAKTSKTAALIDENSDAASLSRENQIGDRS
jgi:hypothetical protein